jgi:hypothetical protein
MSKIYLYMGRRDKKGVKILSVFPGINLPRSRVEDLRDLHLPSLMENAISKTIHENRFLWEVWMEGAERFDELKKRLEKRGYRNIPIHADQIHPAIKYSQSGVRTIAPNLVPFDKTKNKMLQRKPNV